MLSPFDILAVMALAAMVREMVATCRAVAARSADRTREANLTVARHAYALQRWN